MKVAISAAGLLLATTSVSGYLWPIPREHSLGSKVALVSSNLTIAFSCESDILSAASQRYQDTILKRTFKPPTQYNSTASGTEDQFSKLLVKVHNCQATYPTLEDDESYNLTIPDPVPATEGLLEANTVWGALRGLETFSQLTYTLSNKQLVIGDLPVAITDSPAYPHRGLMLDTARNYFPVDDIKRTLDAMSYNKFNVFHWHIIDAQSWPVESKFLPDLYLKGAYDSDMTYSHRDVQDIIDYARDRGIRVVPEFEMPGHLSVVHHAKPEIMTCVNSQPHWDLDSAEPPSGQLNPLLPETYTFTQDLVNEYSGLFKDQFFHTGNDEVNT
ncbi:Glucosamine-6-phosphate isomerase (Glucosamine-6-phosphate deaminase) (GNPDA) (GlcN6P deaminase), partial [Dimargaris verticillata]